MFLSSFDDTIRYWKTLEIMPLWYHFFKMSTFWGGDLFSFLSWNENFLAQKIYPWTAPKTAVSFAVVLQFLGLPGIHTSYSESGRSLSWHHWEQVREVFTRNSNNYCSCRDPGDSQDLFQPVLYLLLYILCVGARWNLLQLCAKVIEVSQWTIRKPQMNANWNSHPSHSRHLEISVRFEHYHLPTPTMLIWFTLSINSFTPSNAISAMSHTLLSGVFTVWPIGCRKSCSAVERRTGVYLSTLPLSRSHQKGIINEL